MINIVYDWVVSLRLTPKYFSLSTSPVKLKYPVFFPKGLDNGSIRQRYENHKLIIRSIHEPLGSLSMQRFRATNGDRK